MKKSASNKFNGDPSISIWVFAFGLIFLGLAVGSVVKAAFGSSFLYIILLGLPATFCMLIMFVYSFVVVYLDDEKIDTRTFFSIKIRSERAQDFKQVRLTHQHPQMILIQLSSGKVLGIPKLKDTDEFIRLVEQIIERNNKPSHKN